MKLPRFVRCWMPVIVWMAIIFLGSTDLMSAERTSRIIGPLLHWFSPDISAEAIARVQFFIRKTAHVTEYAILAALLWRAFRYGTRWQIKTSVLSIGVWFACAAFAASDEVHQSFVPSRTASMHDIMIDIIGATIGLTVCELVSRAKSETA